MQVIFVSAFVTPWLFVVLLFILPGILHFHAL